MGLVYGVLITIGIFLWVCFGVWVGLLHSLLLGTVVIFLLFGACILAMFSVISAKDKSDPRLRKKLLDGKYDALYIYSVNPTLWARDLLVLEKERMILVRRNKPDVVVPLSSIASIRWYADGWAASTPMTFDFNLKTGKTVTVSLDFMQDISAISSTGGIGLLGHAVQANLAVQRENQESAVEFSMVLKKLLKDSSIQGDITPVLDEKQSAFMAVAIVVLGIILGVGLIAVCTWIMFQAMNRQLW